MATFVSGLYVGTFGGRTLNINVTGNISRSSTTVTLTNISCYLYSTDGGTWWAQANRTWGLRAPGGEAVSTSVPYTPSANHRTFSLPNLSFYLANTSTSCTMNVTGPDGNFAFTLGGIPQGAVAPSGLDVTLSSIQDTGATMMVTLGSYGTPSSEANRYIEASIMGQSTYGGKYRYGTTKASTNAVITVNNNSSTNSSNPLTIVPNTKYWYGAYATNTVMSTSMVKGTFITLPAYISDVNVNDTGGGNVTVSVIHASEGTATTVYTEYSYNQTDWTTVQDTFSLEVLSATTIYVRRRNSTGTTPVRTVSIVPATTVKLYGSVNNQAKEIRKLYGSVNGKAVIIRKLYGSVNGRSKLIYVHSARPGENRDNPIVINSSNATFSKTKHIYANVTESTATDISSWYLSPAPVFFHVSIPAEYNPMGVGLNITITIGGEQKINALSTELGSDQRELLLQWDGSSSLTVL